MKTYREFLDYVEDNIISCLPAEYAGGTVKIFKVAKDNDMVLDGMAVYKGERSSSPTVYLGQYYPKIINGEDEEKVLNEIASDYMAAVKYYAHLIEFDPSDWNFVRGKIGYYLVNMKLNEERIRNRVFKPIGELAKVYMIISDFDKSGYNYMLIPEKLFEEWDISREELDEAADSNMAVRFPPALLSMNKRMKEERTGCPAPNLLRKGRDPGNELVYVLTNGRRLHGASSVVYPGILERIRNVLKKDFYIVPFSTEEMVIIPKKSDVRRSFIADLLREINAKRGKDFFLSNTIYEYTAHNGEMTCTSQQN